MGLRGLMPLVFAVTSGLALAGVPGPASLNAWSAYALATEARVERELRDGTRFLALDFAGRDRRALLAGEAVVTGRAIDVPSAMVHHWTGAILIPGVQLDALMQSLQRDVPDTGQPDVLATRVLGRGADTMTVFLKIQRSRFVTAVFNTEHRVQFRQFGPGRAFSASTATKIAELDSPGTPQERELPPGQDRGFLWRWNAYWRYERVGGAGLSGVEGVIVECESLSLSRGVPFGLRTLVGPLINSTARESMVRTLTSMRAHFRKSG